MENGGLIRLVWNDKVAIVYFMDFVNRVIHFGKLIRTDAVENDDDPFKDLKSGIV